MILLLSVPYTGTRFLRGFLEYQQADFIQHHVEHRECRQFYGGKAVVPIRDPLLNFMSLRRRVPFMGFNELLAMMVMRWELLHTRLQLMKHVTLRLDDPNHKEALERVRTFVGGKKDAIAYGWPVIGANEGRVTTYDDFKSISPQEQTIILKSIQFFREDWGYENTEYTLINGHAMKVENE